MSNHDIGDPKFFNAINSLRRTGSPRRCLAEARVAP
jgi:hypothetical protein